MVDKLTNAVHHAHHTLVSYVQHLPVQVKVGADVGAIGVTVGSFFNWLPNIAALLSIIWLSLQIYAWIVNKRWKRKDK